MKKNLVLKIVTVISLLMLCGIAFLLYSQIDSGKKLDSRLSNPEALFCGIFTTTEDYDDPQALLSSEEICIRLRSDNVGYSKSDVKNLLKGDEIGFNCYWVKRPGEVALDENGEDLETAWYLCDFDGVSSVALLDENHEETGRLSWTLGEENWQGEREIKYYWLKGTDRVRVYKRSDTYYNAGKSVINSKSYSGVF